MGGWNVYQYPLNPMQMVDPLGLFIPLIIGGVYLSAKVVALGAVAISYVAYSATPAGQKANQDLANSMARGLSSAWESASSTTENLFDNIMQMSKGGVQNKANEYSREAQSQKELDPCDWLDIVYKSAPCAAEKNKMKIAQKVLGCRHSSRKK